MNAIIIWLFSLPEIVFSGLVAAVVGGVAGALFWPVRRSLDSGTGGGGATNLIVAFFVAFVISISAAATSAIRRAYLPDVVVEMMSEDPFTAAVFASHPESRERLRLAFSEVLATAAPDEILARSRGVGEEVIAPYFLKDFLRAPDEAIVSYVRGSAPVLADLAAASPAICAGYYFIGPPVEPRPTPDLLAMFARLSGLKAEIVKAAARGDGTVPEPPSPEAAYGILTRAYEAAGRDPAGLEALGMLDQLPPAEGCGWTIAFNDTLVALGPEAPDILRSLYLP